RGQQQELVALHELAHAVVEARARLVGLPDLARRELLTFLDVPDDGVLDLVAMPLEQRAVPRREVERALHLEHLPRLGEIRLAVVDLAAERREGGALGVEYLRHPPVDRDAAAGSAP